MHFDIAAAIRLGGRFDRFVDELDASTDRNILEQEFDIVVTQTHTAVAHAKTNTKVRVGAVDSIQTANVQRVQTHRVVRAGRHNGWQRFTGSDVLGVHFGSRRPGWARFLTLYFGGPVQRGVFTQLTDTNRQNDHSVGAFRVVIQTHFGAVNHDTFMDGVRQDQLLRNVQHGTAFRQIRVNTRVGFHHVGEAELIFCCEIFQRLGVAFFNGHNLVLTHQTATVGWQWIGDSRSGLAKPYYGKRRRKKRS
ncbi:hypothetical protein D3C76_1143140 [compost metagenome]